MSVAGGRGSASGQKGLDAQVCEKYVDRRCCRSGRKIRYQSGGTVLCLHQREQGTCGEGGVHGDRQEGHGEFGARGDSGRVGVDRRAGQGGRGKRSTKSGAPGAAGEKFVAEEHETPQRRTTVAASERDEELVRKTGEENEELRNVFVPKGFERMNPGWVTSEGLSLTVELASVTGLECRTVVAALRCHEAWS